MTYSTEEVVIHAAALPKKPKITSVVLDICSETFPCQHTNVTIHYADGSQEQKSMSGDEVWAQYKKYLSQTAKRAHRKFEGHNFEARRYAAVAASMEGSIQSLEDLDHSFAAVVCNQFLSIDLTKNNPMTITVHSREGKVVIGQESSVTIPKKYFSELSKLTYIFEALGLSMIEARGRELHIPEAEFVKLFNRCDQAFFSNNRPKTAEADQLLKIKVLCAQYLGHTWQARHSMAAACSSEGLLIDKETAVIELYHARNLEEARELFEKHVETLCENRTPRALYIVKALAIALTFPLSLPILAIYSKLSSRNSFAFYKPEGELLAENLTRSSKSTVQP